MKRKKKYVKPRALCVLIRTEHINSSNATELIKNQHAYNYNQQ